MNTAGPGEPFRTHRLAVTGGHALFVAEYGNPSGTPLVVLHGGPGSGCDPGIAGLFDPDRWRVILPDQRGAGRSEPVGGIENNATPLLLDDLELIRRHLGIERWFLHGGSWGVALALLYVRAHPERWSGILLRGTFLARRCDRDWFFGPDGVARLFPTEYAEFLEPLEPAERETPLVGYHARLRAGDLDAAQRWSAWESRVVAGLHGEVHPSSADPTRRLARARVASHYAVNDYFLGPEGAPLELPALAGRPCRILHGRHDLVCPFGGAALLSQCWPGSELQVIEDAGHVAADPAMAAALTAAARELWEAVEPS